MSGEALVSYQAALDKLYRLSAKGIVMGLDRVRRAARHLGAPQSAFRSIQVAGTNGKGTVSTLTAHALERSGVRTGLFTSPHFHRFSERIRIDGEEIAPGDLLPHLETLLSLAETRDIPLTFFEVATLAALAAFREAGVEVAVLEVGLGGRLDATSIADPAVSAVTSIGFDHTAFLGDTLSRIAEEKAAIARDGVPLILGDLPDEALKTTIDIAERVGAPCCLIHRDFDLPENLLPPWPGAHQRDNTAIALELYRVILKEDPRFSLNRFREALETVSLPGRFEVLERSSRFILDGAHNLEAVSALAGVLDREEEHPEVLLFGALSDKPAAKMLSLLRPRVEHVVLVPPPIARALDPRAIAGPEDKVCDTVSEGVALATGLAPKRTILVTGSIFTVAAVRGELLGEPSDPPIGM